MKLLVTGSRKILNLDLSIYIPENTEYIITGTNKGIDSIAQRYADEHNIKKLIFSPNYTDYGKRASYKLNRAMVEEADEVLIFSDGKIKSIIEISNYAAIKGKSVTVVFI